ncbi:MAG: hypothetical protein PHD37_18110 [Gallionellaceae bacterium]|nr:hypothetical protein [Gallionellaceae bacterium]
MIETFRVATVDDAATIAALVKSFDYPLDAGVGVPLTAGLQVEVLEKAAGSLCRDSGPARQAGEPAAPPELTNP